MKILHFCPDQKFIPFIQKTFEEAMPNASQYRVQSSTQSAQKFIKNVMSIRNLSLRSQELTKEKYGDFSGILKARASGELAESPDVAETFKVETPLGTYFFDSEEAMIEYKKRTGT